MLRENVELFEAEDEGGSGDSGTSGVEDREALGVVGESGAGVDSGVDSWKDPGILVESATVEDSYFVNSLVWVAKLSGPVLSALGS
jgi:hypothetical protein